MPIKAFLLLSFLTVTNKSVAQITQGGPPDDQLRKSDVVNWEVDDKIIVETLEPKVKKLLPSLTLGLKHCVLKKKKEVQLKDLSDFYRIYLGHSFVDLIQKKNNLETCIEEDLHQSNCSSAKMEKECQKEDLSKLKCLKKKVDQKYLKDILGTSAFKKYLMINLKVNAEEAEYLQKKLEQFELK